MLLSLHSYRLPQKANMCMINFILIKYLDINCLAFAAHCITDMPLH